MHVSCISKAEQLQCEIKYVSYFFPESEAWFVSDDSQLWISSIYLLLVRSLYRREHLGFNQQTVVEGKLRKIAISITSAGQTDTVYCKEASGLRRANRSSARERMWNLDYMQHLLGIRPAGDVQPVLHWSASVPAPCHRELVSRSTGLVPRRTQKILGAGAGK